MKVKPVLGDWEIPHIESIQTAERRNYTELAVPGRTGSLYQDLNSAPVCIALRGSLFGDEARDELLEAVRTKFKAGEPVTFVADIVTATDVQYVVIDTLRFEESGNRPDQLDYLIVLRESPPPPPAGNPMQAVDSSVLDAAVNALDSVTGALDALDTLSSVPDFGNPVPPLQSSLEQYKTVTSGLSGTMTNLRSLFGLG